MSGGEEHRQGFVALTGLRRVSRNFLPIHYRCIEMKIVALKNGTQEPEVLVVTTMMNLDLLMESDPLAVYEMTMLCRDENHRLWGGYASTLARFGLLQPDGKVHSSIKNIVLSAVQGEDLEMKLGSPLAG
jgi:hypothetical protein